MASELEVLCDFSPSYVIIILEICLSLYFSCSYIWSLYNENKIHYIIPEAVKRAHKRFLDVCLKLGTAAHKCV